MDSSLPFLLGVNYWPRKKAMFMWQHFDPTEIRDEFSMIRSLGLTHVRFFLLWESFQLAPDKISSQALADLRTLADIAADLQLKLQPTFFTGHMSGPNWAPDWFISNQPRHPDDRPLVSLHRFTPSPNAIYNVYAEPFVLDAEKLLLRTVCQSLKDHPALWAWSLGNEPDIFCIPPHASDKIGRQWIATMTQTIKEIDPIHPVTIGLNTTSLDSNPGLRPDHAAQANDLSVMHGYSIYHPIARSPLDPDFVPFACSLTQALASRPVLFEEFGLCTHLPDKPSSYQDMLLPFGKKHRQFFASESDGGEYYAHVLPRLQRVGALGAFAWCFADYDPILWDKPPCDYVIHERSFGLFRADGSPKPAALAIQKFARSHPKVLPNERPVHLHVSPDDYFRNPAPIMAELYDQFGRL